MFVLTLQATKIVVVSWCPKQNTLILFPTLPSPPLACRSKLPESELLHLFSVAEDLKKLSPPKLHPKIFTLLLMEEILHHLGKF